MLSFKIVWSTPSGRFGWTTIEECADAGAAAWFFNNEVRGDTVPADAVIDTVKPA